jgi:hypothetical protein
MSESGCEKQQIHCDLDLNKDNDKEKYNVKNTRFPFAALLALQDNTKLAV